MFIKGQSGNPAGRKRGEGQSTRDVRNLARNLFDAAYWKRTKERLTSGKLHPAIEKALLAYAYGEPKKTVTVEGEIGIREKRRVLTQLPDAVIAQIVAQEAFDQIEGEDEATH